MKNTKFWILIGVAWSIVIAAAIIALIVVIFTQKEKILYYKPGQNGVIATSKRTWTWDWSIYVKLVPEVKIYRSDVTELANGNSTLEIAIW